MSGHVRLNLPLAGSPKSRVVAGVVARLKQQIERREFRPGDQLPPERELACELGVSRPSVRRAIAFLSAVGVIDVRHGSGTFVAAELASTFHLTAFSRPGARCSKSQMREARLFLTAEIARLAALRADGVQLSRLAEEIIGMHRALEDPNKFSAHVESFHGALQSAAGNNALSLLLRAMLLKSDLPWELARHTGNPQDLAGGYHSLYSAVQRRDCSQASARMTKLIRRMRREYGRLHTMEASLTSPLAEYPGAQDTRLSA